MPLGGQGFCKAIYRRYAGSQLHWSLNSCRSLLRGSWLIRWLPPADNPSRRWRPRSTVLTTSLFGNSPRQCRSCTEMALAPYFGPRPLLLTFGEDRVLAGASWSHRSYKVELRAWEMCAQVQVNACIFISI